MMLVTFKSNGITAFFFFFFLNKSLELNGGGLARELLAWKIVSMKTSLRVYQNTLKEVTDRESLTDQIHGSLLS